MVGKQAVIRKKDKGVTKDFYNMVTGEAFESQIGTITTFNVRDEDYVVVDSKEYVTVDLNAIKYLETILTNREMDYVMRFTRMCDGEYNILHNKDKVALSKQDLKIDLDVAKTTFIKLMNKLHTEGVISYLESYISRNKKVKYVVLNPTLARRRKKIRKETASMFWDLSKGLGSVLAEYKNEDVEDENL